MYLSNYSLQNFFEDFEDESWGGNEYIDIKDGEEGDVDQGKICRIGQVMDSCWCGGGAERRVVDDGGWMSG